MDQFKLTTDKLANWKYPRLDQVQKSLLKYFTSLNPTPARVCNILAKEPSQAPTWLTRGGKTLIHKKGPDDVENNY